MAGGSGPRYAPEDPSLPHPWRALVDGSTGYIYYWNTDTNITQYDKPHAPQGHPPSLPSGSLPAPAPAPKLASEAVRASPGTNADAQSARHADRRHFDSGNHAREGAGLADSSQHSNSHGTGSTSHHSSSHGNRFAPSEPSGAPPGNVYIHSSIHASGHHSGHLSSGRTPTHPGGGGHMPSSGTTTHHSSGHTSGSFASRPQPAIPGGGARSGPEMPGTGMVSGGSRSGGPGMSSGHPRSGAGVPGAGGRANSRDRPWESSMNRDGPWGSGGGSRDGSWGSSGRDSQWGSIKQTYGSSGASVRGGPGGNMHGSTRIAQDDPRGRASLQPRVATIPMHQRQQTFEGFNPAVQSRQMGEPHLSVAGGRSYLPSAPQEASHKRSASDLISGGPDLHKRPRLQGFSEPPRIMDADGYRRQHEVTVMGNNVPPPLMTFESANFPPEISRELLSAGFAVPTPIQAQSWPIAVQGHDLVGIAKTGSGKTLGYLLPGFLHILRTRANGQSAPIVLVLAPTRELATQIHDEAVKFGRSSRISSTCVYGGAPKGQQLRELERGTDIVIATPGRLNDFLEMKKVSLRQVSYLVLDEADRMLDMGFEPQIRKIVKEVPLRRQTSMFTATWPREVRKIAADLLANPVHVTIGNCDELTANKAITQYVEMVHPYEKQRRLEQILRSQEPGSKTIIFCSTKKMCEQLARGLGRGFGAAAIHGDKSQGERDHVLAQFKAGRSPILVATDVAARGLDVKDIRVVINYDFPTGVEDYVHRIGRTGRAGATGLAFTFFSEQDSKYAKELIKILEGANQVVPVQLREVASRSFQARGRGIRWGSGSGAEPRDAVMGSRGMGGRDVRDGGWGSRDEGAIRGGSLGSRGGGFVGRDPTIHSRTGPAGGRPGAIEEKGGGPGSRVGVTGGRGGGLSGRGGGSMGRASGAFNDGWDAPASGGWGGSGRDDVGGHGDVWGRLGGSEQWPGGRHDGNGIGGGRGGMVHARSRPMGFRDAGGFNKVHSKEQEDTFRHNDGLGAGEHGDGPKEMPKGDDDGWEDAAVGLGATSGRWPSGFIDKQPEQEERGRGHIQDDPKRLALRERRQSKHGGGDWSPTIKRRRGNSPASGGWNGRSRSPSKGFASGSGSHSGSRSPYGKSGKGGEDGWSPPPGRGTGRSRSLSPRSTTAPGYPNVDNECKHSGPTTAEGGMLDFPLLDQPSKESKLDTSIDLSNKSVPLQNYHLADNATPVEADSSVKGASDGRHSPTAADDLGFETPVQDEEEQSHLIGSQPLEAAALEAAHDGAIGVSHLPSDEGVERDLEGGFDGDV